MSQLMGKLIKDVVFILSDCVVWNWELVIEILVEFKFEYFRFSNYHFSYI